MVAFGGGRVHEVEVPTFYARLGEAPWTQPVMRLPLYIPSNNDIVGQVTHRQALFGGLAQSNPDLATEALQARFRNPCVQALHRATRVGFDVTAGSGSECPDLRGELARLGLRWVIWRDDEQPGGRAPVQREDDGPLRRGPEGLGALLGDPDWRERSLVAWEVR
jgi:hypothetical protein